MTTTRRRIVVDDSALAQRIGSRLKEARLRAGLTQQQLAQGRYTKAYVSALEKGHAKPSMAALNFLSERLALPPSHFLGEDILRWSRVDADILLASGRWQAAADAYQTLVTEPLDQSHRAEVLCGLAEALCRLERGADAIAPATEAAELFRKQRREREVSLATYWLAYAQHLSENVIEARALLSGVLADLRASEGADPDLRLRVLMALSSLEAADGQHRAALGYLEEARTIANDLDDWRRAAFLSLLAYSYTETGDLEAAIRSGVESLGLFRAAEAQHEAAILENNLALAYVRVGNTGRAREYVARARTRHAAEGDRRSLAHVADTEAQIALADGDAGAAIGLAEEAIAHAEASGNHRALVSALLTDARAKRAMNEVDPAIRGYEKAAQAIRQHGPRARLREALGEWAEMLASSGRHAEAYELTREALQATSQQPSPLTGDTSVRPNALSAAASRS